MIAPPQPPQATGLKGWLQDFPATSAGHVAAISLILLTGIVVAVRLARGLTFPDGYDGWLVFLATLAGVSTAGMIGKRVSDVAYKAAGTSPVNVAGPSTVNVTAEAVPVAADAATPSPSREG